MASMNAGIILSGQQPNFLQTISNANQAAAQQNQFQRTNQLNDLYQEQGAQIAAGDQGALNALAKFDPNAALVVQGEQQFMRHAEVGQGRADAQLDINQSNLGMRQKEFAMQVQQHAANLSAGEAAAQAEKIKQGVFAASAATSPQQWDQIVTQFDQPDLVGQFANKGPLLQQFMTAAQILEGQKANAPDNKIVGNQFVNMNDPLAGAQVIPGLEPEKQKPADEYGRYFQEEAAAGRQPLSRIDFAKAKQKNSSIKVDSDGNVTITEGGGAAQPKMTVDAAKNTGFLIRTQQANNILDGLENEGTNFTQQGLENVPFGLGNFARTEDFQKYDQARRDFVNAILRRESGAVIADSEFENANKQYFPVPGDGPEVIAQKRQNRKAAVRGLEIGSGGGAALIESEVQAETQSADDAPQFEFTDDAQRSVFEKYSQP